MKKFYCEICLYNPSQNFILQKCLNSKRYMKNYELRIIKNKNYLKI